MRLSCSLQYGFAAALISAVAVACSSGSSDDAADAEVTCPVASGCPDSGPPPSYKTDILPILQQACIGCHSPPPAGTAGYDETSYTDVYNQRAPILDQVHSCMMPPTNGTQLTAAQRIALTTWLYCGAPDN
jgi:uncharacterized membrane protein